MQPYLSLGLAAAISFSALSSPVQAQTTTMTFDNGVNTGGWTFGVPATFPATGGNPGAFMRTEGLDTTHPQLRTTGSSVLTGDYRTRRVQSVGIDLNTIAVDFSAAERPLTVILVSQNGTPADASDDWGAYVMGPPVPIPSQGWLSYSFNIPSQATSLPGSWAMIQFGPNSPANPSWHDVISRVDQLRFFYGDPTTFAIFQMWTLGADNIFITVACAADADGSGTIEPADVAFFVNIWFGSITGGTLAGDFDGNGLVQPADVAAFILTWFESLGGGC